MVVYFHNKNIKYIVSQVKAKKEKWVYRAVHIQNITIILKQAFYLISMSSGIMEQYQKYCAIRDFARKNNIIDLSGCSFLCPTCLLPLINFIKNNPDMEYVSAPYNVEKYISIVDKKEYSENATYVPPIYLPQKYSEAEEVIEILRKHHNNGIDYGGQDAFNYMIGELIDNIYQHSQFENASIMAQRYEKLGFVEITIYDDGLSIPFCFEKHDISIHNDCQAIEEAIKGRSTKSDERGYGLATTTNLYVNGCNAQFFIVSRNGAWHKSKIDETFYNTEGLYTFSGTLVSLRIPYPINKVNIYDYIA
ncbi:MAG: hypothetical protein AWU58_1499 [Methanohalophilus sp. T328-1]|nr:MAG: hypothetical protein AWU58_1499 [Methanohalophilus sp. T328-1]